MGSQIRKSQLSLKNDSLLLNRIGSTRNPEDPIRNDFPLATGHQFWRGFNHKLSGQIGLEEDINLRLRADLGMVALQQRDVFDNDHEDKE